ncbi:MAG: LPS export ABC transporter periplasmic protein LptC [Bacteroidota bacterium]
MRGICILLLGAMMACSSPETVEEEAPVPQEEDGSSIESFGVSYVFSDSARLTAKLKSRHVIEKEEDLGEGPEPIHYFYEWVELEFYDENGNLASRAEALGGKFRRKKRLAELTGDVVLSNLEDETLRTEQLFWDARIDSIYTYKPVEIETPDKIIRGSKGLKSNSSFTEYSIFGIQGEMETDENFQ